jgi:diamine N-acetyltransferase
MISIKRANINDAVTLSGVAIPSFIESHGHSAPIADINNYVNERYNPDALREELRDEKNMFHIIYSNEKPAGYSKIMFNHPYDETDPANITKLERIYVLKEFYDKKLGKELFGFNREFAKQHEQSGMWLFVWVENERAFNFYIRNDFKIAGAYDFRISPTHTNPNHRMRLLFS